MVWKTIHSVRSSTKPGMVKPGTISVDLVSLEGRIRKR